MSQAKPIMEEISPSKKVERSGVESDGADGLS